jgi:sodium-dependent phosphate cotransporter
MASLTGTVSALIAAISHLLFNIVGILIIYGLPFLREIPIYCAENIAEKAVENKLIPVLYLVSIFVIVPLLIILAST